MPPLTRQQTFRSTRSWWSDSNPNLRGPTINLHAAAKPLMKLLYNRQVLDFIRNIEGNSLSAEDAEIYGNYLSCEYVSLSTKSAILEDLSRRAYSDPEALVVHSNLFHDILKLLEGPVAMDTRMWKAVQPILQRLAERDATADAACSSLVALVCDSRVPQVVEGALVLLSEVLPINFPPVTSGASEAKFLDRILDILGDLSTAELRDQAIFRILVYLALHESTAVALVEASTLKYIEKQLRSPTATLHPGIYRILDNLVSHKSTAIAVFNMHLYDLLATLWRENSDGRQITLTVAVIKLLANIARWREGAEGLVTPKLLNDVLSGLQSLNDSIRLSMCALLHALVGHETTVQAVVTIVPREDIVVLLSDWNNRIRESAAETLRELDATLEIIDGLYYAYRILDNDKHCGFCEFIDVEEESIGNAAAFFSFKKEGSNREVAGERKSARDFPPEPNPT
ncbi:hypothetical protein C8J57DRAFT_1224151 [Mycena rebaudengoi]|nr:hypothetical protein C8J57DRAFT_1224151 [Mycena rebaudengoi]